MSFFQNIALLGSGLDLNLHIKEKNGKLTVSAEPLQFNKAGVRPLIVTGTAAELDEGYFDHLRPVFEAGGKSLSNVADVEASAKVASEKSAEKAKPPAGSEAGRKAQAKKQKTRTEKSKKEKPDKKKPAVKSPALKEKVVAPAIGDMFAPANANPSAPGMDSKTGESPTQDQDQATEID
jgi:PRTRC genetic system protein E